MSEFHAVLLSDSSPLSTRLLHLPSLIRLFLQERRSGAKKASVNLYFSPHEGKSDGKAEAVAAGNGGDARLRRRCGNNRVHVELWNAALSSRLSAVAVSECDQPFLFPNYRK